MKIPSALGLGGGTAEQGGDWLSKAHGKSDQCYEGDVELAALDLLKVFQVKVAPFGHPLERPAFGLAQPTKTQPQSLRLAKVPSALLVHPRGALVGPRLLRHPPRTSRFPPDRSTSHVTNVDEAVRFEQHQRHRGDMR
jgi:hypothetical protein